MTTEPPSRVGPEPGRPRFLPRAIDARNDAGPLLRRTFLMPFQPALWSSAASWTIGQVIVPLLLLTMLLSGALAFYRTFDVRGEFRRLAGKYDASYPAIIVEKGEVRVEGDRVIQWVDGDTTILVDPLETIPMEKIETREAIVVRRTVIIRKRPFRTETTNVADIQQILGDFRFDGNTLAAFEARWGLWLALGLWLLLATFLVIGEAVTAALYSAAAGGLALLFRGRGRDMTYGQCVRVALAADALLVVVGMALHVLGWGPGFCLGFFLWPASLTALATWRAQG